MSTQGKEDSWSQKEEPQSNSLTESCIGQFRGLWYLTVTIEQKEYNIAFTHNSSGETENLTETQLTK